MKGSFLSKLVLSYRGGDFVRPHPNGCEVIDDMKDKVRGWGREIMNGSMMWN